MRIACLSLAFLGAALAGAPAPINACGGYGDFDLDSIKLAIVPTYATLRGNHLLCVSQKGVLHAVDLRRGNSIELGKSNDRRWHDGDVADRQLLLIAKDRLQTISLIDGRTVHDLPIGNDRVWAFGFASKDRAFINRGKKVEIIELATGKSLHTVELGGDHLLRAVAPWQKVGNRLFIAGPGTTLCVIDLEAGKLLDRFSVDARGGISQIQVEGSLVYCVGSPLAWGFRNDHLVCLDMESKKSHFVGLARDGREAPVGRIASGPYGTAYLFSGDCVYRCSMSGDRSNAFKTPNGAQVLAIWNQRAVIATKDEIRFLDIKETPVAQK
jgi:hypothetical protein